MHYTKEEDEIIKNIYPKDGVVGVQKIVKRTADSIRHRAKAIGITRSEGFRLSDADFSKFINPQTEEAAYFLGMIWGDGNVRYQKKTRAYRITLAIKESDFEDVRRVFSDFKVIKIKKIKESWKQCICAYRNHKILASFLKENDYLIKSKASPTKILNKIPQWHRNHFYRAWFDADGYNNRITKGKYSLVIAGTYNQEWLELEKLCDLLSATYKISRIKRKNGNKYSVFLITGYNSIIRFREYLYKDATIGLRRKWNNFLNIREPLRLKALKV